MRESCPWFMPQDEARSMIQLIEAKIRTSDIEVRHETRWSAFVAPSRSRLGSSRPLL